MNQLCYPVMDGCHPPAPLEVFKRDFVDAHATFVHSDFGNSYEAGEDCDCKPADLCIGSGCRLGPVIG